MDQQYPGNWNVCATCAYWAGKRESDTFGNRVTVDGPHENGKCCIPCGGWKGQNKQANSTCTDWKKWPVLI